jgi:hypothetical protein
MGEVTADMIREALPACVAAHPVAAEAPLHRLIATAMTEAGRGIQQFAVGVNKDERRGLPHRSETFADRESAIAFAQRMLDQGRDIDVGPMGINVRNWERMGLTVLTAFDLAPNVCAGARILGEAYHLVVTRQAHCLYNSGRTDCRSPTGSNGYPEKVEGNVRLLRLGPVRGQAVPQPVEAPKPACLQFDLFERSACLRGEPPPPAPQTAPQRGGAALATVIPAETPSP